MAGKRHNGYMLIMLLIVIAIGIMIYYMDIMWMGTDGQLLRNQQPPDENQPWKNEALIKGPNQPAAPLPKNSVKPKITSTLNLSGQVALKDEKRGQINLTIQPNGTIVGNWQCQYSYTHAAYEITAKFKGNTDATQNASGDLSKLYLIAKGDYIQKATNLESGEVTEAKGTVYINGWLGLDMTASGTLATTTDKKSHVDYNWNALPN